MRTRPVQSALCIALLSIAAIAQITNFGITQQSEATMKWFRDAKFGLFIHWGIYSGPAKGEWYMQRSAVPIDTYRKYAFPATPGPGDTAWFQADAYIAGNAGNDLRVNWMKLAKEAGMKYACVTVRHHDGYVLIDSVHPNSFSSGQTLKRNLYDSYITRCREEGLKLGLYFSPMSWRYPGYYDVYGTGCKTNTWGYTTNSAHKENARQMKEEMYAQLRYVIKKYSPFDYIYWDGGWLAQQGTDSGAAFFWEPGKYRSDTNQWKVGAQYTEYDSSVSPPKPLGIMGLTRKYSPNVLCNQRCGWIGDFAINEGNGRDTGGFVASNRPWERNCNYNMVTWGFNTTQNPMGYDSLVRAFTNILIRDGNLLLNYGPDRHGFIPQAHIDVALQMGAWLKKVGDAVYGTRAGPWQPLNKQYGFTKKDTKIFIHLLAGYTGTTFTTQAIPGGNQQVTMCYDLYSQRELTFTKNGTTTITISGINRTAHPSNTIVGIYFGSTPTLDLPESLEKRTVSSMTNATFKAAGEYFSVPRALAGKRGSIAFYDLRGRQLAAPVSKILGVTEKGLPGQARGATYVVRIKVRG